MSILLTMVWLAYITFTIIAIVFGAVIGYFAHFARAHATFPAEDLGLGEPWDTLTRDDYQFEKHVLGAKWDDNGYWDDASNRNLLYMVGSFAALPFLCAVVFVGERAEFVSAVCSGLSAIGINSPVCPG